MSIIDLLGERREFAGVPRDVLSRVVAHARMLDIPAGDCLLEEGSPPDAVYIVAEGEFEVTRRVEDRELPIGRLGPGDVLGEMALLEDRPRSASASAVVDSTVAEIGRDGFAELLSYAPFVLAMLRTVSNRTRRSEARLREADKLAALGTMTAGLMHELNNPVAAVARDAARLGETLSSLRRIGGESSDLPPAVGEGLDRPAAPVAGTLDRADREDEVAAWLEAVGVDAPWEVAAVLVAHGWDTAALAMLQAAQPPDRDVGLLVRRSALATLADDLSEAIRRSADRIAALVGAVKRYARKDEAPVQNVDVHASLEDTLIIVRPEQTGVRVVRDYAADLPHIEAYGSELNQVWTNLVTNATEAMHGEGTLTLRTRSEDHRVVVEVADSGPGIPAEVRPRIFEPYFTTKPPGAGTGLGLHLSYEIVARHGGDVEVESRPGETTFRVSLPHRLSIPPHRSQTPS